MPGGRQIYHYDLFISGSTRSSESVNDLRSNETAGKVKQQWRFSTQNIELKLTWKKIKLS